MTLENKSLTTPVRSLKHYQPNGEGDDPIEVILSPWDGSERRFPCNVVIYGGDTKEAQDFASAVDLRRQAHDTLWRVGRGPKLPGLWIERNDSLLNILNCRVLFTPGDRSYNQVLDDWRERADRCFIGPGEGQEELIKVDPQRRAAWPRRIPIIVRSEKALEFESSVPAAPAPEFFGADFHAKGAALHAASEEEMSPAAEDREWYFPEYDLHVRGSLQPLGEYRFDADTRRPELSEGPISFQMVGRESGESTLGFKIEFDYAPSARRWQGSVQIRLRNLKEDSDIVCMGRAS